MLDFVESFFGALLEQTGLLEWSWAARPIAFASSGQSIP